MLNTFGFIKAVSDTELDMINVAYHDKSLIFIGATIREKLIFHHQAVNAADYCLLMIGVSDGSKLWHLPVSVFAPYMGRIQ